MRATAANTNAGKAIVPFNGLIGRLLLYGVAEDRKLKTDRASAELIKPDEKYTWSGTLSLHMRVNVRSYDNLRYDDRVCFTGPTANSENIYSISEYFKNLDVETDCGLNTKLL